MSCGTRIYYSSDKQRYTAQRDKLQQKKGRLKEVIVFLQAAHTSSTKSCAQTTRDTIEMVNEIEKVKEEERLNFLIVKELS